MPKGHQEYAEWTPVRLIRWAGKNGSNEILGSGHDKSLIFNQ
jgi:hypothetical protein